MAAGPDPAVVRRTVLRWYSRHGRPFPWRETRDPYRVLVSEIMLQQTRAELVAARLPAFLETFPDIGSLAAAPLADVLRAWRGMGYNNRAVRLHGAVREMVARYGGEVPGDTDALRELPGIGRYTAHAVACFAHGRRVPVVDVNVRRVLSRIFRPMKTAAEAVAEREAWEIARSVLPADAYGWHQALMDFGAMVCTARAPKCGACPLASRCRSVKRLRGGERSRRASEPVARKPEPSHGGVARRFWRGRVVEALRESRAPRTLADLRRIVRPSGAAPSSAWIADVVARLEKDGVLEVRRSGRRVEVALAS